MGGLIELLVVFLFALGWGVIELVCLRYDKQRREQTTIAEQAQHTASTGSAESSAESSAPNSAPSSHSSSTP